MVEQLPLGVALGRVVGRLVGPSMPGHVGLPVAGAGVVLEIDEAQQSDRKCRHTLKDRKRSCLRHGA